MRLRRALRRRLAPTLAIGCLLSPPVACAVPAWVDPATLSAAGRDAQSASVALGATGDAVVVWQRSNGTNTVVQASVRPAGGAWGAASDLSAAGQDASAADVAIDAQGTAVATWQRFTGTAWVVQASIRPAGGSWGAPDTLSTPATEDATSPQVAVDAAGNATVAWRQASTPDPGVVAAFRPAATGTWSAPVTIEQAAGADRPQLAVGTAGHAALVWERTLAANTVLWFSVRLPGGPWSAPGPLSAAGQDAGAARVAVNAAGDTVATWRRWDGANTIVQARHRRVGSSWTPAVDLSAAGSDGDHPDVGLADDGSAIAIWARGPAGGAVVESRVRTVAGSWLATETVTPPGENGGAPELAVDAAGNAVAVYLTTSVTPSTTAVAGTRRAADGGTWAAPVPLGELDGVASARPDLAVDGDGNALATWDQGDGSNLRARARALDVAGPVLSSAVVPDTVQAGAPVQLAVAPLDVWGQLAGDPTWSFGDGSLPATGRSVSHTWANPGSYGVSVSASDAFGNVRVHTRMLTVVASPGAPPAAPELTPLVSSLRVGRVGRRMHATLALPPGVSVTCRLDRMGFVVRGIRVSTAYLPLRQVCRRGAAGTVTLRLGALRPGLYRLRVVATSTDGRTAVVQRGFRVRRARSA